MNVTSENFETNYDNTLKLVDELLNRPDRSKADNEEVISVYRLLQIHFSLENGLYPLTSIKKIMEVKLGKCKCYAYFSIPEFDEEISRGMMIKFAIRPISDTKQYFYNFEMVDKQLQMTRSDSNQNAISYEIYKILLTSAYDDVVGQYTQYAFTDNRSQYKAYQILYNNFVVNMEPSKNCSCTISTNNAGKIDDPGLAENSFIVKAIADNNGDLSALCKTSLAPVMRAIQGREIEIFKNVFVAIESLPIELQPIIRIKLAEMSVPQYENTTSGFLKQKIKQLGTYFKNNNKK